MRRINRSLVVWPGTWTRGVDPHSAAIVLSQFNADQQQPRLPLGSNASIAIGDAPPPLGPVVPLPDPDPADAEKPEPPELEQPDEGGLRLPITRPCRVGNMIFQPYIQIVIDSEGNVITINRDETQIGIQGNIPFPVLRKK